MRSVIISLLHEALAKPHITGPVPHYGKHVRKADVVLNMKNQGHRRLSSLQLLISRLNG